jgi:hypothetical protein
MNRVLDHQALSGVRGAGNGGWVFGWIRPFIPAVPAAPGFGTVVNFFQTNNIYVADQMNNQFQSIDIHNAAPNANIHVAPVQAAVNVA